MTITYIVVKLGIRAPLAHIRLAYGMIIYISGIHWAPVSQCHVGVSQFIVCAGGKFL
jgi:hypothetical protein